MVPNRQWKEGGCSGSPPIHFPWRHVVACTLAIGTFVASAAADEDEKLQFFRDKIEPVLKSQCFDCHSKSAKEVQGGLRLDSASASRRGGESGPAVVPGKVSESLLIQAMRHESGLEMPPRKSKLSDAVIADFTRWIEQGALDPRHEETVAADNSIDTARKHWAFQPIRRPPLPRVSDASWPLDPIDVFVLERLESSRLGHAAPASKVEWIRRVTFDLTGLPPDVDDIDAFVNDLSPDAHERVVDRLLGSPLYGERWAQQWLDVVRYAETEGYEYDRTIPDAWRYRDYVINSLNVDKPFDRFVVEQIAGDEIEPENAECLTATIFHRLGPVRRNAGNPEIALSRNEVLTERTDIIGAAFLGLTMGCARCHNHKLEPILQKDYYRLQAYLAATEEHNVVLAEDAEQKEWESTTRRLKDEIAAIQKRARLLTGEERTKLTDQIEALEDQLPAPLATIPSTRNDFEKRTSIYVLRRGVWENKGELVGPRPPSVLVPDNMPELSPTVTDPKSQLAAWLAGGTPLVPRVLVNRVWLNHFGAGLVKTPNDFGLKGDRPSHPELLDWLAAEFLESGQRLKPLHRAIASSQAYRLSSRPTDPAAREQDPENRLLTHFNRRRLTAEELRDAMLAVAGRLNQQQGGASIQVPVDKELVQLLYKPSQWQVSSKPGDHERRSIYLIAKRNLRLPFMENLDAPTLQSSCARRDASTHAPQALEFLNGDLSNSLARAFAEHLRGTGPDQPDHYIDMAFRRGLGRRPTARERERSIEFLRNGSLSEFALAIFNLNEFLYVP